MKRDTGYSTMAEQQKQVKAQGHLLKAACVELSSKRSDRHIHALITLAQLGGHFLSLQQRFPSFSSLPVDCSSTTKCWRVCYLWSVAGDHNTPLSPKAVTQSGPAEQRVSSWCAPVSLLCRQQSRSALKESAKPISAFRGKISSDPWIRVWKLLHWSCWREDKQGVSTWTWWTRFFFFYVNLSASTAHVIILCGFIHIITSSHTIKTQPQNETVCSQGAFKIA